MKKEIRKVFVLQHAHRNNGFEADYLAFVNLDDAERKADAIIEEYCKDYTDEEKDEVDGWRTWDYSEGKEGEWFVRIDPALFYENGINQLPEVEEVIEWISYHPGLYGDFKKKFKYAYDIDSGKEINKPDNIEVITDWLSEHKTAYDDFCKYFNLGGNK